MQERNQYLGRYACFILYFVILMELNGILIFNKNDQSQYTIIWPYVSSFCCSLQTICFVFEHSHDADFNLNGLLVNVTSVFLGIYSFSVVKYSGKFNLILSYCTIVLDRCLVNPSISMSRFLSIMIHKTTIRLQCTCLIISNS